jgi:hypothetical protein
MKTTLAALAIVLLSASCAYLTAKPTNPCKGQYCIEVSLPGIPGAPELCYKTADELTAAKVYWQAKGYRVSNSRVQEK